MVTDVTWKKTVYSWKFGQIPQNWYKLCCLFDTPPNVPPFHDPSVFLISAQNHQNDLNISSQWSIQPLFSLLVHIRPAPRRESWNQTRPRKKTHADCWWLKFGKLTSWGNGSLSHYLPWASEHHPTSGIFSPDFSTINQFSSASSALEVDTNQVTAKRVGHSSHCLGTELFSAGNQEVVKNGIKNSNKYIWHSLWVYNPNMKRGWQLLLKIISIYGHESLL